MNQARPKDVLLFGMVSKREVAVIPQRAAAPGNVPPLHQKVREAIAPRHAPAAYS